MSEQLPPQPYVRCISIRNEDIAARCGREQGHEGDHSFVWPFCEKHEDAYGTGCWACGIEFHGERAESLRAALAACVEALGVVEWVPGECDEPGCAACGNLKEYGHASPCAVAAALERARKVGSR